MPAAAQAHVWRFGVFEVDAHRGELRRVGNPIKLREQSLRILLLLLENAGEIVTREDLRKALWPGDTYVDFDHSLNAAVMKLREALGDTADKPVYIETIPRRGYRFIAPLVPTGPVQGDTSGRMRRMRTTWPFWVSLCMALAISAAAGIWFLHRPLPPPRVSDYVQLTHDPRWKEVAAADDSRVYLNLSLPGSIAQLSPTGGELASISIQFPGEDRPIAGLSAGEFPNAYDLSPDGSTFLCSGPTYSLWSVTITGTPVRHLATAEGAAWSPDGKSIVFTWRGDIWVMKSDGSDTRMLVPARSFPDPAKSNSDLSWSPDGGRIRFTRDQDLWEVSPSGPNLHRLLPGWKPALWKSFGRWTRDGQFFVFLVGEPSGIPNFTPGNQLWVLDERRSWPRPVNREPIQLTSGLTHWGRPVPSRDGSRIFARGVAPNGELLRYDRRANQWNRFLAGRSAEFLTFSPDRKAVAFVQFPEEVLYRINLDGTGLLQLTEPPLAIRGAQWSPDGSQIVVNAQVNESYRMYIVSAQGGPLKRLIPDDTDGVGDPHWSPDGRQIVYGTNTGKIKILDVASGKTTNLPGSGEDFSPRWSPDGRYVAALTVSARKLKVFDLKSNTWKTLDDGIANYPVWSGNGRYIYFLRGSESDQIVRVPVGGGRAESVLTLKGMPGTGSWGLWFGLDPDDAPLYLRDKGTDEIYSLLLAR